MDSDEAAYHELCGYTLGLRDPWFIHQHVVDAFAAQRANAQSKPIGVTFSLAGLYLHVERGLSGRHVQKAHMQMGREKRAWPAFKLPETRGSITAADVLAAPEGPERDKAIDAWCASVWSAFAPANRQTVIDVLKQYGIE